MQKNDSHGPPRPPSFMSRLSNGGGYKLPSAQSYTNAMLTVIAACLVMLTYWGSRVVNRGYVKVYDPNISYPSNCGSSKLSSSLSGPEGRSATYLNQIKEPRRQRCITRCTIPPRRNPRLNPKKNPTILSSVFVMTAAVVTAKISVNRGIFIT